MSLKELLISKYFFILIFAVVAIRVIGIWHGYPYVYNVDEPTLVKTTLSIRFNPFIDRFDWPHFNYYFHYSFYWIFIKLRGVIQANLFGLWLKDLLPFLWNDPFIFYIISRAINTLLSIVATYPIYKIIKKITLSEPISRISALFFLMIPYIQFNSRLAIQDTATTAWIAFALYFLLVFIEKQKLQYLLISSLFLGLSTAVKYNALLFTVLVPLTLLYQFRPNLKNVLRLKLSAIFAGVIFIIVFVAVNPGIIVYWNKFWSDQPGVGIFWQLNSNLSTYKVVELPKQILLDALMLFFDLGVLPFIAWVVSIPFIKKSSISSKHKYFLYIITGFSYLYAINAARYTLSGSRFYLPIYPITIISMSVVILYFRKLSFIKHILGIYLSFLFVFFVYVAYIFFVPTTLNLAYQKYLELSRANTVYIKAEDMERLNLLNNLKLKTLRDKTVLQKGDIVMSGRRLELQDGEIIDIIGKSNSDELRQGRLGSAIFIYEIK